MLTQILEITGISVNKSKFPVRSPEFKVGDKWQVIFYEMLLLKSSMLLKPKERIPSVFLSGTWHDASLRAFNSRRYLPFVIVIYTWILSLPSAFTCRSVIVFVKVGSCKKVVNIKSITSP